jgi:sugar O-acyltransferase (sialic acid O-acetyltransferase NeuD family)
MLVFGTGGHAIELFEELIQLGSTELCFYNDANSELTNFCSFPVIKSLEEIKSRLKSNFEFVIGVGNPHTRYQKQLELINLGGNPISVISNNARIVKFDVALGIGLNVMSGVQISSFVSIGDGCLINRNANLHHHVKLGAYCEVAPNAVLLGAVHVGEQTFIGAGAVVLPGIKIGRNCIIGAGSIVTKDVADYRLVKGNPAK